MQSPSVCARGLDWYCPSRLAGWLVRGVGALLPTTSPVLLGLSTSEEEGAGRSCLQGVVGRSDITLPDRTGGVRAAPAAAARCWGRAGAAGATGSRGG